MPTAEAKTSPPSCHRGPAFSLSSDCFALCVLSASTAAAGSRSVRLDFFVLTSPWIRTERHTATCGGTGGSPSGLPSRSTWSHRSARASSVRHPVSRHSTMYAYRRDFPACRISDFACSRVSDLDGRPAVPGSQDSACFAEAQANNYCRRVRSSLQSSPQRGCSAPR